MQTETTPSLEAIIGMILCVSIASERLVEISKGFFTSLNATDLDPREEARRKSIIQIMSVVAGLITAFLSSPILAHQFNSNLQNHILYSVAIGLLASGGSGFWNAILGYMLEIKNMKKAEVLNEKNRTDTNMTGADVYRAVPIGHEPMSSNECYDVGE